MIGHLQIWDIDFKKDFCYPLKMPGKGLSVKKSVTVQVYIVLVTIHVSIKPTHPDL